MPGGDESIAAVVTGARYNRDFAARRVACHDGAGYGGARILHEELTVYPRRDGGAVRFGHLGVGE
jgi:hypothetical protein